MRKLVSYKLSGQGYADRLVHRPTPIEGDPWGMLASLKGTSWEPYIYVVSGEAFSHALHGYLKPLEDELGPSPLKVAKRIPYEESVCELVNDCVIADRIKCVAAGPPPDCWSAPTEEGERRVAMEQVVVAWRDGSTVIVVEGEEFSLS